MIVDCHSHLLPGIDDGSRSSSESAALINELNAVGVDCVVLTPHYYVYEQSVAGFIKSRELSYNKLTALPEARKMRFVLGAEVFIIDLLFNLESLEGLNIGNTRYLLAELPPEGRLTEQTMRNLEKLYCNYNMTPIIAHIDRYPYICDIGAAKELRDMGCLIQMNIQSLTRLRGRKKLLKLAENGLIDFFGNDLHRAPFSAENYKRALTKLQKALSGERLDDKKDKSVSLLFE